MKKVLGNIYIQLFLGLIAGVIATISFYPLAIIFYIKYAGLHFFDLVSSGDKSPITFIIALSFTILVFTSPALVWLFLNKFGNLKSLNKGIRIITFILFTSLPLLICLGWIAFSILKIAYKDYQSVVSDCVIKNGVNRITYGENTKEVEYKNGILNGKVYKYSTAGNLEYEGQYSSGLQDGIFRRYDYTGNIESEVVFISGKITKINIL